MAVYFIHDERAGAVKIGRSDDPIARLRQLQTGNAGTLSLLGVLDGDRAEEADWHRRFQDRRLSGEWFSFDADGFDELKAELGSLGDGGRQLISDFRSQGICYPELSALVSIAVGFPCSVYWMGIGGPGAKGTQYQVMRWDEGPGPGREFWSWHLCNRPQFFPTPEEACVHFAASHKAWVERGHGDLDGPRRPA